ncbi:hypothetical protein LTR17_014056 [Elasticomyces elasticus]|nr:hypothetical protein LTR17_014056 [Elasticomyces elasticus]
MAEKLCDWIACHDMAGFVYDKSTANTDDSPLSKIPAELRNNINEFALYQPYGVHLDLYTRMEQRSILPTALLALTTCKQMRAETHDMLFAINSFTVHTHYFRDISVDTIMWYDDNPLAPYRTDVQDRLLALVCGPYPMLRHTVDLKISLGEIVIDYNEVALMGRALDVALDRLIDPCRSGRVTCTRPLRVSFVVRMDEMVRVDDYTVPYSFEYGRDRSATAADLQLCFDKAESGWRARRHGRALWAWDDLAHIHSAVYAAVFEPSTVLSRRTSGFDDESSVDELRKSKA